MVDAVSVTNWQPNWRIERFEVLESTNSALLEAGLGGLEAGLVYVAAHQTAGRGRLDRKWLDEPGGALMFSVLLPASIPVIEVATRAMALAVRDGCESFGVRPDIKWPNDLMMGEAKLAGILGESRSVGDRVVSAVVGCGLNVRSTPKADQGRKVTSLAEHSAELFSVDEVLTEVLDQLAKRFARDSVASDFATQCHTVGRKVAVEISSGLVEGVVREIDTDGNLMVDTGNKVTRVSAASAIRTKVKRDQ